MSALYETKPSLIEGNGWFAITFIAAGAIVERFEGEVVTMADLKQIEAEGKYHSSLAIGDGRHLLLNVIDPREFATPLDVGSGVGGPNHSCDSNLWMQDEVTIVTRRNVAPGEELTLDYSLASDGDDPDWRMPCRCGAGVCRGTVTGSDWQLPEVQERYKGHFSPFLNERIARLSETPSPSPNSERGSGGGV